MSSFYDIPLAVCSDSYKAGHFLMYPDANKMVAYGEFRRPYERDADDSRFVAFGIRHFVETYLVKQWTVDDVERAAKFYATHNTGMDGSFTPYPFPKELFLKFVKENDGFFPVTFQALRDGSCAHVHVPIFQITATGEYARLATFLETVLTHMWHPSNVATLSRRTRDLIERAFERSVDDELGFLIESRLHDFGFRGAAGLEASTIGGCAHLLNFRGSDTMAAAYYAQFHLNDGRPVAQSIPATEHSVMTSWPSEEAAIANMVNKFGHAFFACVLDSYDYQNCLDNVLPLIAAEKVKKGGFMTLRPDSGDPAEAVVAGLKAAEKVFGATKNKKGYKMISSAAVIQGDGVGYHAIGKVLDAVMDAGYSAGSVLFGMGGGLLTKHNRDTMSMATKLCHIEYASGEKRDIMKMPKSDSGKISLPGVLEVKRVDGVPTIFPEGKGPADEPNMLETIYDRRPLDSWKWEDFDTKRARLDKEWRKLPKTYDPISKELRAVIDAWVADKKKFLKAYAKK